MNDERRIPVIVAIGEVSGRGVATSVEPLELIHRSALNCEIDATTEESWLRRADSILVCHVASWAYANLASDLCIRFGAKATDLFNSPIGGQWPARLLDRAAARIATGESTIAVIAGGESQASMTSMTKSGRDPVRDGGWTTQPGGPPSFDLDQLGTAGMQRAGLITPVRVYPLFENRLRFDLSLDPSENSSRSSELYSAFSTIAADNLASWHHQVRTADDIGTPSRHNRMVCEPYPLSMNAMPHVDQAAAVIVTSLDEARRCGVPANKIVHVWGGAGAEDTADILDRESFGRSLAMESAIDRTLDAASIEIEDIDVLDVYSCFPIVPKMAVLHLGASEVQIPSATGGHSSFGGPLSSYSLHAVAAAAREIRAGKRCALVHANGGYMTYQHSVLLGKAPHPAGYIGSPDPVIVPGETPPRTDVRHGPVTIETVTVEHSRQHEPHQAFLVARDSTGRRVAAQTAPGDLESARALSLYRSDPPREIVGTTVTIDPQAGGIRVQN